MSSTDAPEVSVPPPAVPDTPMDPTIGTATSVSSVSLADSDNQNTWLDNILSMRQLLSPSHPFSDLRNACDKALESMSIPSRSQESWRFTNLRTIYSSRYAPVVPDPDQLMRFDIRQYAPDTAGVVIVFLDGVFNEKLSLLNDESAKEWIAAGGFCGPIAQYKGDVDRVTSMFTDGELGVDEGGFFPTVGNALASDAVVLEVPPNFSVSRPVAVCFVSTGSGSSERASANATRLATIVGAGSKLSLLECHASLDHKASYGITLSGSCSHIAENATLSHYVINNCAEDAHIIQNIYAKVLADAKYEIRAIGIGGSVGRFTIGIDLFGRGSHALLHGALLGDQAQVLDLHSRICHGASDTTSDQLHKNVSSDRARMVFNGKIIVTEKGERTDSSQLCRSLLLSEKASVDAMPVLEIATDDVKCTHGATVSDLQDDELFYCQSRGLSLMDAQYLLVSGFALATIGDCPFPTVREQVEKKVEKIAVQSLKRDRSQGEFTSV